MTLLVTGGAGFIGSNFILDWLAHSDEPVINLDKLTYAGNLANLMSLRDNPGYSFVRGDIGDAEMVSQILSQHRPRAIVNFAAESHVDRSIANPDAFIQTNILGMFRLLDCAKHYWHELKAEPKEQFRFLHISTDEVYGSLAPGDAPFTEKNPYAPNSPYAASKAASDHLIRSYHHTYGLPGVTINCSNNYGPHQFPEKLIPLCIHNALHGKPLPVYGDGQQVRDWLYVADHSSAIRAVLAAGRAGETYNVGGNNEHTNLDTIKTLCNILNELKPAADGRDYAGQITFVKDRPGHDRRYAIDSTKIRHELGWQPIETFESGLRKTIQWYLDNPKWIDDVVSGVYQDWVKQHYAA